jgi:hypothetical protein
MTSMPIHRAACTHRSTGLYLVDVESSVSVDAQHPLNQLMNISQLSGHLHTS